MTEAVAADVAPPRLRASDPRSAQARLLRKRHAAERRFKWYGRIAILFALGFLAILLTRVVSQGYTAFWTHSLTSQVRLDPARVDPTYLEGTNFNALAAFGLGLTLFAVTLTLNVIALKIVQRYLEQYD